MNRKKKIAAGIAVVSLLAAFGLTLYPLISNYYAQRHASSVYTDYKESIIELDTSMIDTAKSEAAAYNASLVPGTMNVTAYSSAALQAASEKYEDLLNLSGNGLMGYLDIPKLEAVLPIYHGTEDATLEIGVGHLLGSSLPVGGESTHAVLSGHSGMAGNRMLSDLPELKIGDVFYLEVLGETLAYQVDQIKTVLPSDTTYLSVIPGEDLCTLVTCTPFGINTHRLLVRGTRIPYEEAEVITAEKLQVEDTPASTWEQQYIKGILLGIATVAVILVFCIWGSHCQKRRRRRKTRQREQFRPRKRGKYEKA